MKSKIEIGVAAGMNREEFYDLPERTKTKLIRLMARIAEKSYRRGYQHGGLAWRTADPYHFRFKISLDKSPFTDTKPKYGCVHTSIERLFMENGALYDVGFREPMHRNVKR